MNAQTKERWAVLLDKTAIAANSLQKIQTNLSSLNEALFVDILTEYIENWSQVVSVIAELKLTNLAGLCSIYEEAVLTISEEGRLSVDEVSFLLKEWHISFGQYLESMGDQKHVESMLKILQNPLWTYPLLDEDLDVMLQEGFVKIEDLQTEESDQEEEFDELHLGGLFSNDNKGQGSHSPSITPDMIGMIRDEFKAMADEFDRSAASLADGHLDLEKERSLHEQCALKLQNLSRASMMVHLNGLNLVFDVIYGNLQARKQSELVIDENEKILLVDSFFLIQQYFEDVSNLSICMEIAEQLQSPYWANPILEETAVEIVGLLSSINIEIPEKNIESLQTEVTQEDISLQILDDVNQDVLESLFSELPGLTRNFSVAIQRVISDKGEMEDIRDAQRIAHTVKGSSSTVGIIGIVTLTHCLEDILSALAEEGVMPIKALGKTLLLASDCLEGMTEFLLGQGHEPEEALDTLQEVINWTNLITLEGVPVNDVVAIQNTEHSEVTSAVSNESTSVKEDETVFVTTRVPSLLVDKLLQMNGEEGVLNEQLQEQKELVVNDLKLLQSLSWKLHLMVSDLGDLLNVQSLSNLSSHQVPHQDFDSLEMDQYNDLHTCANQMAELVMDFRETNTDTKKRMLSIDNLLAEQRGLQVENRELIESIRMVPIESIISRCQRVIRQVCRMTGKSVEMKVHGENMVVDSKILNDLMGPLTHLLRNAVDHGIESEDKRIAANKNSIGQISLNFESKGNYLLITCQDDGAGLDYQRIHSKAISKGLISGDQELTENDVHQLILSSGFSTRDEVTQTSGRGVGLDAIKSQVSQLKGSMALSSQPESGLQVSITVPLSMSSMQVLLVRCGNQVFAIMTSGLRQVVHSGGYSIDMGDSGQTVIVGENSYGLQHLHSLLGIPSSSTDASKPILLIKNDSDDLVAILVDELIGNREMLVKNMGEYIPAMPGVIGASILGDGGITLVLDIPELIRKMIRNPQQIVEQAVDQLIPVLPNALIVDDSLSARRLLANLLKDSGFNVITAIDGMDAIEKIDEKRPDILLVDMEMPRMNGIELTAHVRNRPDIKDIPVLMITSRSSSKHRKQAEGVGVSQYITKPYLEDNLLQYVFSVLDNNT